MSSKFGRIIAGLLTAIFLASCASYQPTSRGIASTDEEQLMELHFQALINGQAPEQEMIDYIDRLVNLLILTNKDIATFEKELDAKIAIRKKNSRAVIEEPLASKTYTKLLKKWKLKDRYTAEIAYFYLRCLEMRTDKSLSNAEHQRIKHIQQNTATYLANTQDLQRVELQELMTKLSEVFTAFVQAYKEDYAAKHGGVVPPVDDTDAASGFGQALFGSTTDLYAYIKTHNTTTYTPSTPADQKRQAEFISTIDQDLGLIEDPDRDVQSVQDLTCKDGKQICISTGEAGNIVGKVFPKGVWAFTFDDGPAKSTTNMLAALASYSDNVNPHAKATFFQLANAAPKFPDTVKAQFDAGYPLENHSFTHPDLAKSSVNRVHEINDSNVVLTKEYQKIQSDYVIQYFRCPYGSCYAPKVPAVRQMIADQKQVHVYWRIDSLDWKLLNGPKVSALVTKQMQLLDHGVILMHDIHPTTIDAVKLVLAWMKDQNNNKNAKYKMVTIPEAVDLVNGAH